MSVHLPSTSLAREHGRHDDSRKGQLKKYTIRIHSILSVTFVPTKNGGMIRVRSVQPMVQFRVSLVQSTKIHFNAVDTCTLWTNTSAAETQGTRV